MTTDPIPSLIEQVDGDRLRRHLFYLSKDPLPFRKLNFTVSGHAKCTLYEADDFLAAQLEDSGYEVEREAVQVQALRTDRSKPMPHQFSRPELADPWYTAYNLYARKRGTTWPDEYVIVIAHKDSQSWTDSPGAHDNACGTVGLVEMARVLSACASQRTIWFVLCNEEHVPWTSETVAAGVASEGLNVRAVLNVDSIAGKSDDAIACGRRTHSTRYTTDEGLELAHRMAALNERYAIGLETDSYRSERPNDDDGSFIVAGIPNAILNIGSYPYADAEYHSAGDIPERVDIDNLVMAVQLSLAFVVDVDRNA